MLSVSVNTDQKAPCIFLEGRLDANTCEQFDDTLQPILEKETWLIIDLSKCFYISSSGIRSLLKATKILKAKEGALFFSSISPTAFQVIEMAGLHQIFELFDTLNDALKEVHIRKRTPLANGLLDIEGHTIQLQLYPEKIEPTLL